MALGFVGVVTTILYEVYLAHNPFLRKSLFQNRSTIISYAGTLQQGMMVSGQPVRCLCQSLKLISTRKAFRSIVLRPDVSIRVQIVQPNQHRHGDATT